MYDMNFASISTLLRRFENDGRFIRIGSLMETAFLAMAPLDDILMLLLLLPLSVCVRACMCVRVSGTRCVLVCVCCVCVCWSVQFN